MSDHTMQKIHFVHAATLIVSIFIATNMVYSQEKVPRNCDQIIAAISDIYKPITEWPKDWDVLEADLFSISEFDQIEMTIATAEALLGVDEMCKAALDALNDPAHEAQTMMTLRTLFGQGISDKDLDMAVDELKTGFQAARDHALNALKNPGKYLGNPYEYAKQGQEQHHAVRDRLNAFHDGKPCSVAFTTGDGMAYPMPLKMMQKSKLEQILTFFHEFTHATIKTTDHDKDLLKDLFVHAMNYWGVESVRTGIDTYKKIERDRIYSDEEFRKVFEKTGRLLDADVLQSSAGDGLKIAFLHETVLKKLYLQLLHEKGETDLGGKDYKPLFGKSQYRDCIEKALGKYSIEIVIKQLDEICSPIYKRQYQEQTKKRDVNTLLESSDEQRIKSIARGEDFFKLVNAIDISKCPQDFQTSFKQLWRDLEKLEKALIEGGKFQDRRKKVPSAHDPMTSTYEKWEKESDAIDKKTSELKKTVYWDFTKILDLCQKKYGVFKNTAVFVVNEWGGLGVL